MVIFKRLFIVLLWTLPVITGERWYSAGVVENDHIRATKHFSTNYIQDSEHRFLPLTSLKQQNLTAKNKWHFMKKPGLDTILSNKETNENDLTTSSGNQPIRKIKPPPAVFSYNNTIKNINVIKAYPKRKTNYIQRKIIRKRCPSVGPRQKKQLISNLTAEPRFLEVFEVVEFDHVSCTSSSGLEGTCLPEYDCTVSGGTTMGTCADGYGTCCVIQFSCDDHKSAPSGWFTNPGFPSPSTERLSCALTLEKSSGDVRQIRLDFTNFELLPPIAGTCEQDQFVVSGQNVNNIIPILCGVNTGQHVYIEVGYVDGPIILSVQTVSSESRLFSIKVTQLTAADELAPSGCLQYFKEPQGFLESFNYRDKSEIAIPRIPSYLNTLNYAMCIERAPESCSVTYTNTGYFQIVNYDADGLPVIPPGQAGVEIFNCPTDWLLISAVRLCGDRLNDGSVLQDFALDAPVTDIGAGPIVVWFRSDGGYVGRGFKLQYQQNNC